MKNSNKNNIKIFDKHKSNIVGVGVLDDPKTKQKHTNKPLSNNPTSNIKFPTSNAAITLIALIITIIVLLILAGVTLNMVMGENGLFGKANNAKNKTEVAQYEEELRMCVLELQTEEASNGRTFNMDTIRDNLDTYTQKLEDEIIEWKEKDIEEPTGIYKGYNFYIDKKYGAHITGKATGIQISMKILSEIPETGYTNQDVNLKITITNNEKGLKQVTKPDGNTENLNGAKTFEEEKTATENTKYTYVVTDTEGKEETKEVEIKIIDKNAPKDFSITAEKTEEGLQITANPQDAEETETNASSGINKVEYYVKKDTETEFTNKGTENPIKDLESGTYSVYAKAYDKAGNWKDSEKQENVKIGKIYKNITAQMVAEHPEIYYGLTVTNYESQNGQNDWKIFYSDWKENPDDAHIFLITGDLADLSQTDRLDVNTRIVLGENNKYRVRWNTSNLPEFESDIEDKVLTRFKAKGYNINKYKDKSNSKCISDLLNSNYWMKYKDNGDKAEYAIGSPTIEMWMDSWNNLYKDIDGSLYYKVGKAGYDVGTDIDKVRYCIDHEVMEKKKGFNNKLYYLGDSKGYLLASTSNFGDKYDRTMGTFSSGEIGQNYYEYAGYGLRPVVSLNKDVTVNAKDSE